MLNYLQLDKDIGLEVSDMKLFQLGQHLTLTVPYLADGIDISQLSYQLMLILKNTISDANHISIYWYNRIPGVVEVVYNKNNQNYWIIDDESYETSVALQSNALLKFKQFFFLPN